MTSLRHNYPSNMTGENEAIAAHTFAIHFHKVDQIPWSLGKGQIDLSHFVFFKVTSPVIDLPRFELNKLCRNYLFVTSNVYSYF